MSEANVLTQAEIDALLGSKPADERTSPVEETGQPTEQVKVRTVDSFRERPEEETTSGAGDHRTPPPGATEAKETAKAQGGRAPAPANEALPDSLQALVAELTQRLERVEAAVDGTGPQEKVVADLTSTVQTLLSNYQAVAQQLQLLTGRVQETVGNAQAIPGFGLRKAFKCSHCASQGTVAVRIRCTGCGREHWWGWWPNKKK